MQRDTFNYGNQNYRLTVLISRIGDGFSSGTNKDDVLNTEDIELFSYENKMNALETWGSITYTDKEGIIDRYVSYPYVSITVNFCRLDLVEEGKAKNKKEVDNVSYDFFLDNVEILESKPQEIKYILYIRGINCINLQKTCNITTYPIERSINDIIVDILVMNGGILVDCDSFDTNSTKTKVSYISNGRDNILQAVRYLQNKQYYYRATEDNLYMISFNDRTHDYSLFSTNKTCKWQKGIKETISMVKNEGNPLEYRDKANVAFVCHKPNTNSVKDYCPRNITAYDMSRNRFSEVRFSSQEIINYHSSGNKTNKVPMKDSNKYETMQSYWNNEIDIFQEQVEDMIENNGLKLNVVGKIGIVPGDFVKVDVSIKQNNTQFTNSKIFQTELKKYDNFSGTWFVSDVIYRVRPKEGVFRQVLSLMRNHDSDVLD